MRSFSPTRGAQSLGSSTSGPHHNLQVQPDRLVFEKAPSFKAERFIVDPLLKSGYLDPAAFRKPEEEWPRVKLAKVQASRDDQLALYKKWDLVHSLYLLPAESSEVRYRCGLFSVYKDEHVDRQILNPVPENSRCYTVSDATLHLAHSALVCHIYIPKGKNLVIGSDDLKDFYHAFEVTDQHAARNHLHGTFDAECFEGWNCYRPELQGKKVVGCFRTLAMRTSYAVELAQHSHTVLLQRAAKGSVGL